MIERKVSDPEGLQWTCVQAMSGVNGAPAGEIADRLEAADGTVPVVCTPSGGAQSVRVELARDWEEKVSDEDLVRSIADARM